MSKANNATNRTLTIKKVIEAPVSFASLLTKKIK